MYTLVTFSPVRNMATNTRALNYRQMLFHSMCEKLRRIFSHVGHVPNTLPVCIDNYLYNAVVTTFSIIRNLRQTFSRNQYKRIRYQQIESKLSKKMVKYTRYIRIQSESYQRNFDFLHTYTPRARQNSNSTSRTY